ncbi:hypothetical protein B0O80DRAFT_177569 [Mortierella sp. GBAus27b]|nr:hypothetical protein B0O80DRAFT_177569 [Mortierella sp. GBAus27b]
MGRIAPLKPIASSTFALTLLFSLFLLLSLAPALPAWSPPPLSWPRHTHPPFLSYKSRSYYRFFRFHSTPAHHPRCNCLLIQHCRDNHPTSLSHEHPLARTHPPPPLLTFTPQDV